MKLEKERLDGAMCAPPPPFTDTDTTRTQVEAGACVQAEEGAQLKRC